MQQTGSQWEALQASKTTPSLERCDAGEMVDVVRLLTRSLSDASRVSVWHAAGVLADALLPQQRAYGLAFVSAPKVHGAWILHTASMTRPRHTFALFSSVVALLGGIGQANYAAANVCLDALAALCRTRGVAATSVQWSAWTEVGMAARSTQNERYRKCARLAFRPQQPSL